MADNVLTQMGNAIVRECGFQGKPAIEKQNASEVELYFYQYHAPAFRARGLGIPNVYSLNRQERRLIIEFIPQYLTLETLHAASELCERLAIIHHSPPKPSGVFRRHSWSAEQTDLALSMLQLPTDQEAIVLNFQTCSDELFEPQQWVSGDTNVGNWGRRAKGELVLFDWERFGYGSPAIDLAPLIKGMGDPADINQMVERYRQAAPQWLAPVLVRHVVVAKAWLITEVLSILHHRHPQILPKYLNWYRATLPGWLPMAQRLWAHPQG
ncbi:hypothetical protein BBAD15_g1171 [Beauveria bassiana D1-5]|uniref:Aminoglycoside phosphotransferase domain-containing protein n=1 Tax=Beauveria bassiana D1-5 TaxID=1245745 RepID=A0A0A2WIX7_BEABA|nr:hypothetical protein VW41_08685 [Klebsiella michiganensis]KGQ13089.1 hypothetical protein BBAD15_g1171 [Beauveria bassiana D1-5]